MKTRFLLTLCAISAGLAVSTQAQVKTQVGDVKDSRTTGKFFAGLEVEIKLFGDELADAQSMRAVVNTATDDTGRDLIDHEKQKSEFEQIRENGGENKEVTLKLKNPARKAGTIKELSGEVQLFVPKNDPAATVTVENFQKVGGTPIVSDALKTAGVEITAYTKEQMDAEKAKQQEEKKKNKGGDLAGALDEAFGGMFGMGENRPNNITVRLKDPNHKVVDIGFQDASGKKIKSNGWSASALEDGMIKTYNFSSKLPDDCRLVISLMTPKSLVSAPFDLKDIYLP